MRKVFFVCDKKRRGVKEGKCWDTFHYSFLFFSDFVIHIYLYSIIFIHIHKKYPTYIRTYVKLYIYLNLFYMLISILYFNVQKKRKKSAAALPEKRCKRNFPLLPYFHPIKHDNFIVEHLRVGTIIYAHIITIIISMTHWK